LSRGRSRFAAAEKQNGQQNTAEHDSIFMEDHAWFVMGTKDCEQDSIAADNVDKKNKTCETRRNRGIGGEKFESSACNKKE
jgi:hypothetical protein